MNRNLDQESLWVSGHKIPEESLSANPPLPLTLQNYYVGNFKRECAAETSLPSREGWDLLVFWV